MSAMRMKRLQALYGLTPSQARLVIQHYQGGRA